jgi:hypothetical protein
VGHPGSICRERPLLSGIGLIPGKTSKSKLSKLLNQENALSVPCLRGDSCSRSSPRGEASNYGGKLNQSLLMSHYRWRSPSDHSDASLCCPGGWRQMHGQNAPVQGQAGPSWHDGADRLVTYFHISTVFGPCREGLEDFSVTRQPLFYGPRSEVMLSVARLL